MKKLIAIALVLTLLLASAACAESVYVERLSNIALAMNVGGEDQDADLSGLTVDIALGNVDEVPSGRLDVAMEGQSMLGATLQIIGTGLYVAVDGMDTPYVADISTAGEMAQESLAGLLADPSALMNTQLPLIPGLPIPKADLVSLGEMIGATVETDASGARTAAFQIPYEMVKQVLSMVPMYKDMLPEQAQASLAPVLEAIDQMVQADSGFALDGTISDDGATSELLVNIYPVSEGVTADTAVAGVYLALAENQANLIVSLYEGEDSVEIGNLALTSDPANATLDFAMDLMGQVTLAFSLYHEEGTQVIAMQVDADGQAINASFNYGPKAGGDFETFALEVPGQVALSVGSETADDGNGGKSGSLEVIADVQGGAATNMVLTSDVTQTVEEMTIEAIQNLENAADISELFEALNGLVGAVGGSLEAA